MTIDSAANTGQNASWSLLAEFEPGDDVDVEESLTSKVVEAIRELEIDPAVISRIARRVRESVLNAEQKRKTASFNPLLTVRVWTRRNGVGKPVSPIPDPVELYQSNCCGWGFFLVEKKVGASHLSNQASQHLIELFLYRESPAF